jgi:hypothetical protein
MVLLRQRFEWSSETKSFQEPARSCWVSMAAGPDVAGVCRQHAVWCSPTVMRSTQLADGRCRGGPLVRSCPLSAFGARPMIGPVSRRAEFREVPGIVLRQAETLSLPMAELVLHLRQRRPSVIVTCAHGSSANAASFGKHLIESRLGIPVATLAPSIATVYRKQLRSAANYSLRFCNPGKAMI